VRRFIVGFFAVIGVLSVLAVVAVAVVIGRLASAPAKTLADTIVITADLTGGLSDEAPGKDALLRLISGGKLNLRDFLDGLERAGADPRVKGLYLRLGDDALSLARVQEVRDAIRAFRAHDKFALAFADSFGEFGPGTRPYYLATACDEIWLQPMGSLGLTGLYAEVPFFKGTLDLLGIGASFDRREQYKTVMNALTETKMTAPHREEVEALLSSMGGQVLRGIAEGRKLTEAEVQRAIDAGPLLPAEARDARLVDRLGYRDEAAARVRERAGPGAELVALGDYLDAAGRPHQSGPVIALIYGDGLIHRGTAADSPLAGDTGMSDRDIVRAFHDALADSAVRAIVFRIDSPGGSVVASETIWREVAQARAGGRPVIVSMGDLAGSGGYYIAAPADKIVAEPATLTGSIGVVAGKLVLSGLFDKLGVTVDSAQFGADAAMFDPTSDFSPEARQRLEAELDLTYRGFKDHVADGRHMSADDVEAVAKGRVWTGEDAKAKGLIDELGGYAAAFKLAKQAANMPPDAAFTVAVYPSETATLTRLVERALGRNPDRAEAALPSRAVDLIEPLLQRAAALSRDPALLLMPLFGPVR
jgi:protease-4